MIFKDKDGDEKKSLLRFRKSKKKVEMKYISQRKVNLYFLSFFVGLIAICALTVIISFVRVTKPAKDVTPNQQVVQEKPEKVDNRLQEFLSGYIEAYFNVSSDYSDQQKREEKLMGYYNQVPEVKGESKNSKEMVLISYKPVTIDNGLATYRVTYEVGSGDEKNRVTVLFGIPFEGGNGYYFVSGLPHFKAMEDYKLDETSNEKLDLNKTDKFDENRKEKLNQFLDLFFKNYTTSQENLDVIAENVLAITGVSYKKVNYVFYKEEGNTIKAYVQVAFSILDVEHSENMTLTIVERDGNYLVTNVEYVIPSDYYK
ncbi:conjugal transfer protein [Streptococcus danieliae]|nr:conjugal transfer protein [Streptococcus danieliae]